MLQLYKVLIASQLEYAASVWQVGNCSSLDGIQRNGLAICLGLPNSAGVEALEVESCCWPLQIRRELSVRQATRIQMKDNDQLIKMAWDNWCEKDVQERGISPFGQMHVQIADMVSETSISMHNLEKEFSYVESLYNPPRKDQNTGIIWGLQNQGQKTKRHFQEKLLPT